MNATPIRVLMVDDNPADFLLIRRALSKAGQFDVDSAATFDGALEAVNRRDHDVYLVDYRLGARTGIELVERIVQVHPGAAIIVLTGHDDPRVYEAALRAGASDIMVKGQCDGKELARAIRYSVERKTIQGALRQSEERFVHAFDHAAIGMAVVAPDGHFLKVNPALCEILGHSEDDLLARSFGDITHPEDLDTWLGWSRRLVEAEIQSLQLEKKYLHSSGRTVWGRVTASLVRRPDGAPLYFIAQVQDVTERRREREHAEETSQRQVQHLKLLNEVTRAIAGRFDLQSIYHITLQYLEKELPADASALFVVDHEKATVTAIARGPKGQEIGEACGFPEHAIAALDDTGLTPCLEGRTIYTPDCRSSSAKLLQALASVGIRSSIAAPMRVDGRVFAILGVSRFSVDGFSPPEREFLQQLAEHVALAVHQAQLHDDLRKAYNELNQTQQAIMQQERLRALGEMASGLAHDINNALSPVIGYAEIIRKVLASQMTAEVAQYLEYIITSGNDIARLVSRMREFYRPRQEQDPLESVDMNAVAAQVLELTQPRWSTIPIREGISIEVRKCLAPELPPVLGAPPEIREALTNLIFNAADAMPGGGVLTVRTDVRDSPAGASRQVVMEIADTGMGMDEQTRQRCLEPFYTTKGDKGSGLGLAMVYGVMKRHEGDIEIESTPGGGSTFRLVFPLVQGTDAWARDREQQSRAPARSLRVLCVDDQRMVLNLMAAMVEAAGHRVERAEGGKAGVEAFLTAADQGQPFDVVITDLGMPDVTGREVTLAVKSRSPSTPVILMTGWGSRMGPETTFDLPVDCVLSKPAKLKEVHAALEAVTGTPAVQA